MRDDAREDQDAAADAERGSDFGLMTYEALRAEMLYHLEQLPKIEQLALLVTATVFSWMALNGRDIGRPEVAWFLWYVPLVVSAFCFYRHQMSQAAIRGIADFIATKLAPRLGAVDICWEEQMRRSRLERNGAHLFRVSNRIFWGVLIASNLLVPVFFAAAWPIANGGAS